MEKVGEFTDPATAIPGTSGKHPITAAIGTAITGGMENAGTKGYLMVGSTWVAVLPNPLRNFDP